MKRAELVIALTSLIGRLIPRIGDEYRASEEDEQPGMQLTIGADADDWSYQTGDNSYSGGAYRYAHWGVGAIYRDSDPAEVAESIVLNLEEQFEWANDAKPLGEDWDVTDDVGATAHD
jgi:hypothetical protein